jgi:hypothetical protein
MTCDFPSSALLSYRQRLVNQADRETDPNRQRDIMNAVLKINQLRILHEDIDGCNCWVTLADCKTAQRRA